MVREVRFIADSNVGKLARWLRMMGYDTLFLNDIDDNHLVNIALREGRILLTKDTQIMMRRVVTNGQLKIILLRQDNPKEQLHQVVKSLHLSYHLGQFTRCLEWNQSLVPKSRDEIAELVPPYVFRTQTQYMQCPGCQRIYWRGTHWQAMTKKLEQYIRG